MSLITGSNLKLGDVKSKCLHELLVEDFIRIGAVKLTAKHKRKLNWIPSKFKRTEVVVRCGKEDHKILITSKGQLVLLNHDKEDLDVHDALYCLGSKHHCRCLTIRKHWIRYTGNKRKATPSSVSAGLHLELNRARKRHNHRYKNEVYGKNKFLDQLTIPVTERASFVSKLLKRQLEKSSLCKGPMTSKMEFTEVPLNVSIQYHRATSEINRTKIKLSMPPLTWPVTASFPNNNRIGINSFKILYLQPDWYENYYLKGRAVIDGCIVLWMADKPTITNHIQQWHTKLFRPGIFEGELSKYIFYSARTVKGNDNVWRINEI